MKKIDEHLIGNGLANDAQYGFTKARSLQMNYLKHTNFVMDRIKANPEASVCTLFIDFAKCFQKIHHATLLHKLRKYKVSGKVGLWLLKWLTELQMSVTVSESKSSFLPVTSGVPEGSCAGPQLAKVMLMDIPTFQDDEYFLLLSFADDTKLSHVIKKSDDVKLFQKEIDKFYSWCHSSHLELNNTKFQAIIFSNPKFSLTPINISDDQGNSVEIKEIIKDLGVLVDNRLTFEQQMNATIQKASSRLYWILRCFKSRDPKVLLPIFKSIVVSIIDFPNLLTVSVSK